jgi:hypothetical protein
LLYRENIIVNTTNVRNMKPIVLHFLYERFGIALISLKNIGVPAIDGLATNRGRKADAQAEFATAV